MITKISIPGEEFNKYIEFENNDKCEKLSIKISIPDYEIIIEIPKDEFKKLSHKLF